MVDLGVKIRKLRKEQNISQEVLAKYLGVSFQAISKWENQISMPDISLIPSIAAFFKISIDELFDFYKYNTQNQALKICDEAIKFRAKEPIKAKKILEKGLQKFPGNEMIMNHLLYVLYNLKEYNELISLCKALIQTTNDMEIKYDAERILIETYSELGEKGLVHEHINNIPEIYFTKLELIACLTDGVDAVNAAVDQKNQSVCLAIKMLIQIINYYGEMDDLNIVHNQYEILKMLVSILEHDKIIPKEPLVDALQIKNECKQIAEKFNLE